MKIEINLKKKKFFTYLVIILLLVGVFVVIATTPNPGHKASEIGTGPSDTGTFTGDANSVWNFPGKITVQKLKDPSSDASVSFEDGNVIITLGTL